MCPLPTCAAVNASHRRYSGAPLRVILEGFQSLLVSMQVVGYHEWEIGFLGTSPAGVWVPSSHTLQVSRNRRGHEGLGCRS